MTAIIRSSTVEVGDVNVFYRHTGRQDAPAILLLHGFPSSSRQYKRLMDTLGDQYRFIAPDYPGYGYTQAPENFIYSFDRLADVIEGFIDALALTTIVLYAFDFGGPVGFRVATRRPELLAGLIVQNANAYDDGLSELAQGLLNPTDEMFSPATTRFQYESGVSDTSKLDPDAWTVDQYFMGLPGRVDAQFALAHDYASNIALYPQWQQWLREHQPPTLVVWGKNDPIFIEPGATAYLRDLPDADVHLLDTGHFALEDKLSEISKLIAGFLSKLIVEAGSQPVRQKTN